MPLSSDELPAVNVSDTTDVPYMDSMDFSSTPRVQYLTEFPGIDSELFRRANGIADMPVWKYKGSGKSADYYRPSSRRSQRSGVERSSASLTMAGNGGQKWRGGGGGGGVGGG